MQEALDNRRPPMSVRLDPQSAPSYSGKARIVMQHFLDGYVCTPMDMQNTMFLWCRKRYAHMLLDGIVGDALGPSATYEQVPLQSVSCYPRSCVALLMDMNTCVMGGIGDASGVRAASISPYCDELL